MTNANSNASNGLGNGGAWKLVLAVLAGCGITGSSWVAMNSTQAATTRDVAALAREQATTCERVTKCEGGIQDNRQSVAELRGDVKLVLQRQDDLAVQMREMKALIQEQQRREGMR